jgi:cytochrome c oxidase subunit 1
MFGRMMNDNVGKVHFVLTFIFGNCTFFPMHMVGVMGLRRRIPDVTAGILEQNTLFLNQFMSVSALILGTVQLIFVANFLYSLFLGPKATRNPWNSNTLEWTTGDPVPGHGNFDSPPLVHCGPYVYGEFADKDNCPQTLKDETAIKAVGH